MTDPDLARRLARLEAIEAITALKARYADCADAKYRPDHSRADPVAWEAAARGQAACFTPDALWEADAAFGGTRQGRPALHAFFRESPWRFVLHYYAAPRFLSVSASDAAASWRLFQVGIARDAESPLLMFGVTHERYRHTADGWLIAEMRFGELHRLGLAPARLEDVMRQAATLRDWA